MNKQCSYCGGTAKSSNAKYCDRCYARKARSGRVKKRSATYRDNTLRTARIREQAAKLHLELKPTTHRDQKGAYTRSRGLQMKADMKVVTGEQHKERVRAARGLKPPRQYTTEQVLVYENEHPYVWDTWAIRISNAQGTGIQGKFATSRNRPPSRITNEAIFAIERTTQKETANAKITVIQHHDCEQGYKAQLDIVRNIKRGENLVVYIED